MLRRQLTSLPTDWFGMRAEVFASLDSINAQLSWIVAFCPIVQRDLSSENQLVRPLNFFNAEPPKENYAAIVPLA